MCHYDSKLLVYTHKYCDLLVLLVKGCNENESSVTADDGI